MSRDDGSTSDLVDFEEADDAEDARHRQLELGDKLASIATQIQQKKSYGTMRVIDLTEG